jgi:predicted ATPase
MPATEKTISSKDQEEPALQLSEWIRRTLNEAANNLFAAPVDHPLTAQVRDTLALCSDDYLFPALRVARSLAEQICKAEEAAGPSLPAPSSNWADGVVVHLQPDSWRRRSGSTDHDCSNSVGVAVNPAKNNSEEDNFEAVRAAALVQDGTSPDGGGMPFVDAELSKTERIYSLGLVFYEIFSGGGRPPEIEQQEIATESGNNETGEELNEELLEDLDSLLCDNAAPIDLEGQLSIFDDIEDDYNLFPKKRQTTQKNNHTYNKCAVSVEPLKGKSVPGQLCDLIANMINCINGTLSGEDACQSMTQVRDDLQLMLEKPTIYLYDQDMGRLSTTGLQLRDTVFGRNQELSSLKECYRRSVSGDTEFVLISGHAGVGKSFLAYEFGKHVIVSGGIFLSGKFDQLQQGKPFSALATAFNNYCDMLLQNSALQPVREAMASELKSSLGREVYYLTKIIPCLNDILGSNQSDIFYDGDCVNAQRRLQYLLCQFVEVISTSCAAPVTLFLDDLQWANPASMAAVNHLLFNAGQNRRFFFLGCYREGEIDEGHPTRKLLSHATTLGVSCTNVKLDCMDEETLNTMVSETLCLFPSLTRSLSNIIYRKTKGNPLFVSRLLLSLSKEGLLRLSLNLRRWEWDKEKIQCQKLPDNVAKFLTHSIGTLPGDVKSSLRILSCFGASMGSAFIKTLERALDRNLFDSLDVAVAEGLLDKIDDRYRFSHDRIQEAAYNMMNFLDRCQYHFTYGMTLAPLAAGEEDFDSLVLFTSATQLNLAGPEAVQDESQNAIVATLNLRAGKKAMEMSDFEAAYSYFDNGISFLRKNHWKEHYTLSLELFNLAAKCALTNGDLVSLQLLSQQVMTKAQSFEDTLSVRYYTMCALAFSSKLPESIEKGLDILSKLGIDVRGGESGGMEACVQETKDLLSAYTDDEILNTRRMTDPTMIAAMRFLGRLETGMTQIMPRAVPYVTQRIIQLSLDHGMSPVSPIGFVHFGSYMAKLGDISGGYNYVKLALSLLDQVGSRESAGEVICIGTQVRAYVEPLQAALEYHDEGYTAAMASGDSSLAAANFMLSCGGSLFAGVKLQTMREKHDELIKFSKERKMVIFMVQTQYGQRSIFKLIGTDEEPKYASSEEQNILATNTSVMATCYFHKAFISFMFRSYDSTKENIQKYFACISNTWANLLVAHAFHAFYVGLISFWLARKSRDKDGQRWQERGKLFILALKKWSESSQWSFENKWYLLETEDAYCNNDVEAAKAYYEKAIASAKDHKVR